MFKKKVVPFDLEVHLAERLYEWNAQVNPKSIMAALQEIAAEVMDEDRSAFRTLKLVQLELKMQELQHLFNSNFHVSNLKYTIK